MKDLKKTKGVGCTVADDGLKHWQDRRSGDPVRVDVTRRSGVARAGGLSIEGRRRPAP